MLTVTRKSRNNNLISMTLLVYFLFVQFTLDNYHNHDHEYKLHESSAIVEVEHHHADDSKCPVDNFIQSFGPAANIFSDITPEIDSSQVFTQENISFIPDLDTSSRSPPLNTGIIV